MCNKSKNKNKKHFCKCFSSEKVLIEHKENCLIINGKQNIKLKSGSISFKNYIKQLFVPFKIYADFECILKNVECDSIKNNSSCTEKYQSHIPCSFTDKFVCIDNKFSKKSCSLQRKNVVNKSIESILSEYSYCRGMIKKHFNKNLIM